MIALLACCPIRLRNLATLRVGQQLRRIGDTWWIILSEAETKSGRPDERPIPEILTLTLTVGWTTGDFAFFAPADALWSSTKGGSLAYTYVGDPNYETTLREIGVAISPHLFRDCTVSPLPPLPAKRMGIASALLQHVDERTVQKHYNKGAAISAVERYQKILNGMMGE